MKLAIISDVHANLGAFEAVLAAIEREKCIKILCAGDLVGYGPDPVACVELARQKGLICVRGNHDDMMLNVGREERLRPEVRDAIVWTREQLDDETVAWLGNLPRTAQYAGVEVVHASHVFKPDWHYVVDSRSVMANFLFQRTSISFNGHTHLPLMALHHRGRKPKLLMLRDIVLPPNHRFLINVGSVGQPRDRNPHAAFVTFETRDREVALHRVPYDIEAVQKRIEQAGLPQNCAARLAEGR